MSYNESDTRAMLIEKEGALRGRRRRFFQGVHRYCRLLGISKIGVRLFSWRGNSRVTLFSLGGKFENNAPADVIQAEKVDGKKRKRR